MNKLPDLDRLLGFHIGLLLLLLAFVAIYQAKIEGEGADAQAVIQLKGDQNAR